MVKKIVIGFLLILLAALGAAFLSLQYLVDKEAIRSEFVDSFKAATGLDLEVSGEIIVETFPSPHVIINSMYVHNAPGGVSSFLLSMKEVKIWPTFSSFLAKRTSISKIDISDVDVEIERLKNDKLNWQEIAVQSEPASSGGASRQNGLVGTTITVTSGFVRYLDENAATSTDFKDIGLILVNGGATAESTMKLNFYYKTKGINIAGKIGNIQHALTVGEMPANLNVVSENTSINYDGNAGYKDGKFSITGNIKFKTDDVGQWITLISGSSDKPPAGAAAPAAAATDADLLDTEDEQAPANSKLLPLDVKSDISTEDGKIVFPNVTLEGNIIKGGMRVEYSPPYDVDIKAAINTLDLGALFANKLFEREKEPEKKEDVETDMLRNDRPAPKEVPKDTGMIIAPKTFFHSMNMTADIKADDTIYNDQHVKDMHLQLDSTNGEMTISQATASLPGDTRLVFAGIGKEGFQGFTLEGEVDATGADFGEAIKVLKVNDATFPAQDFKRFKLKANTTITSKEVRISELAARIENMGFIGGFIATLGDRTKLVAAMRIGGVNLDHFIDVWGIQAWRASLFDVTPGAQHDSFLESWIKQLGWDANVNISMEKFILNGHERGKADFKLTATNGKVKLDDINTEYNGTRLSGSFTLDVSNPLPKIDIKATADVLDMATFFTPDGVAPPAPPPSADPTSRWSHKEFDFHWLDLLGMTYSVKIGDFKDGAVSAQQLTLSGGVDESTFTVDSMTGVVLGANVASRLSIKNGKIPAITIAANITSLDPVQVIPFLPVISGMTGKYNLSFRLDTSGIDMFSWVSSLEGTVGLGGEHVNIHGFNMPGVIHAVAYVRTVADILNVVKRAFPGGDTLFNNIEGQWTVANGVLKTTGARLSNDQGEGTVSSQIDLVNWQMQTVITIALKALDFAHPPSMTITFNGNMDHPDIALDTRSLEQYVTNKTSQQMLQEYGTH